ncbi:hypothetical protein Desdi_2882 [Desulfitobacterium dichloroeliminans LMG P-21439]|uniref:Flagellar protein FliT n=1 Tax=Desulfitobacterium dichloroeliminans (strain LMG P-21439 / DCA1) TaxID=871963 RepID=L0F8Y9_DESDL|nr:hypothetical protein [Desulfitobacterium dichloroeliminans]AGA70294.1 hypothetical protein Desdi_2882 [Desulfitobacterium dichloroeliminans LMG P-21439]
MINKTAPELWQDYLFLTKEMLKFLDRQDMELFYELMNQRERLQVLIEDASDDGYISSPAGKKLQAQVLSANQVLMNHFQATHSKMKHHQQVAEAYSGGNQPPMASRNWER